MDKYTAPPRGAIPLEKLREQWQFQLIADRKLTSNALRVALVISWHLNRETRLAFPGLARLVKLTGVSRRTVIRATQCLERRGHLQITRPAQRSDRAANRYRPLLKGFDVTRNNVTQEMAPGGVRTLALP